MKIGSPEHTVALTVGKDAAETADEEAYLREQPEESEQEDQLFEERARIPDLYPQDG